MISFHLVINIVKNIRKAFAWFNPHIWLNHLFFAYFFQLNRPDSKMCEDSGNYEEEAAPDLLVHKHRQPSQVTLGLSF
jgi:hypothetical protein